ncbi:MAG TPA: DNA-3-methyladenine glycosylase [Candidatus Saccharimonadales bacterium]|nr:DNA-3-methyladenine glycosylase [Candidatus Saccharimonadales bacterium]HSX27499.1 DNA-3-methyladenine glycosylase [Patescibacteria group bacterium]
MASARELAKAEVYLARKDKHLAPIIKKYGPCSLETHKNYYGRLVRSIVGQQLSVKAAASIWQRVLALFDGELPSPEKLLKADPEKLRACGISYPKIGYMKDLAQHIIDGRLDLEHISNMPNDQLIEQLTAVKGIGEWSAHMFMIFTLGRLDVLPVGDLGIRKAMMRLYGLPEMPDPAMCITIANKHGWHPYESVAAWYLWQSLDNSPN